ncbi:MAG TPA: hypothetical protein VMY05_05910 [Acidobacteriota bacterium]|nr:hypothetical protein [Acidobacteriota bacterium]
MDSPYENYNAVIPRLEASFWLTVGAIGAAHEARAEEAAELERKLDPAAELQRKLDPAVEEEDLRQRVALLSRTLLVYGVVILEAMVKDYARYLVFNKRQPATCRKMQDSMLPVEPTFSDKMKDASALKHQQWQKKLIGWIKQVGQQVGGDQGRDSRFLAVREAIIKRCMDFSHWTIVYKCCIIRNLEVHNNGLMNERNHKCAPICDIGQKPSWDWELVRDLFTALDLLNVHLSETDVIQTGSI